MSRVLSSLRSYLFTLRVLTVFATTALHLYLESLVWLRESLPQTTIPQELALAFPRTTKTRSTSIGQRRNSRLERLGRRTRPSGQSRFKTEISVADSLQLSR